MMVKDRLSVVRTRLGSGLTGGVEMKLVEILGSSTLEEDLASNDSNTKVKSFAKIFSQFTLAWRGVETSNPLGSLYSVDVI